MILNDVLNTINPNRAKVRGVDGDTVQVIGGLFNLKRINIRLVGIDCPESPNNSYRMSEKLGQEAKDYTKKLVNEWVQITSDSIQQVDKYGRVLAYIHLIDSNIDLGSSLLNEGLANIFNYKHLGFDKYLDYYKLERIAKNKQIGIWNKLK